MENNNKEIDLVELFIKVLLHVKKYKWIFIASIVIGFSIAYTISKFSTKLYKSHITVLTNDKKGVLKSLLESLSDEQNYDIIANNLNVSTNISNEIVEISQPIIQEREINIEPLLFKIYVTVTNPSVFNELEKGLQFFAENNRYLKQVAQINNSQRNELIRYMDIEINKLDSLRMDKHKKDIFYVENNAAASKQIIDLYSTKQNLEKENKISKTFNIVKSFEKVNNPTNRLLKLIIISVFTMLFFSFLLTIFLELRFFLRKRDMV